MLRISCDAAEMDTEPCRIVFLRHQNLWLPHSTPDDRFQRVVTPLTPEKMGQLTAPRERQAVPAFDQYHNGGAQQAGRALAQRLQPVQCDFATAQVQNLK